MEDCKYYHYVVAAPYGTSYSGPGCLATGGHCIPSRCPVAIGRSEEDEGQAQDVLDGCLDAGEYESWFSDDSTTPGENETSEGRE